MEVYEGVPWVKLLQLWTQPLRSVR
jgi:hypothetical protein